MTTTPHNTISVHKPVMVKEVVSNLITDPNGIYVDGTVGLGGHALEILPLLEKDGYLIGIDRDSDALKIAQIILDEYNSQVKLVKQSYSDADSILNELGYKGATGVLLDLGLSSAQLADDDRGFSYDASGKLDMRFDRSSGISASEFLRVNSKEEIADIIWNFGEDRYSRRIAHNIKKSSSMNTVDDLREAIRRSTPPNNRNRSFARVFQALRIAVNYELQYLGIFLEKLMNLLQVSGRIIIISYHSLEDRLVKLAFKRYKAEGTLNILTKKPLVATSLEVISNSRSRSAKMRIAERIA